jgi:2-iminobutanoate/2-iminopropanoate deaminase
MEPEMAKRQSVNFPGFAHQNPIPNASRIGNMMMSSVISGVDPGTRNLPADLAGQVRNLFTHIGRAVEAAGGTPDNILKITFWMTEPGTGRAALNEEWVKMFPDPEARPARHTLALGAESNALVTCDFVAVFG